MAPSESPPRIGKRHREKALSPFPSDYIHDAFRAEEALGFPTDGRRLLLAAGSLPAARNIRTVRKQQAGEVSVYPLFLDIIDVPIE